jgi:hypothetical protein
MRRSSTLGSAPTLGDFQTPQECVSDPKSVKCADALGALGGAAALSEFGPVGTLAGAYIGGHAREWASGVWTGATGLIGLGGSAPCECQLGACGDYGDDTFKHEKFDVLAGTCKSAKAQAAIEKGVLNAMAPLRAAQNDTTKPLYDRMEICMKLTAFAECAAKGWTDDAAPGPCPSNATRSSDGSCRCDDGYEYDQAQLAAGNPVCVASGGSTLKAAVAVIGAGAVGWGLYRLVMGKKLV